ncbi:MAG: shikimate dehydrogenase [Bacteroidota bacterium]
MVNIEQDKSRYGLVGKNISYSFSKGYFTQKFARMGLEGYSYGNFDLQDIQDFPGILEDTPNLKGLNVTIPYKEAVIPFLNRLEGPAKEIGAVNTIAFRGSERIGHNTDIFGFQSSLEPLLTGQHRGGLILGTGGASKAVAYVLERLGLPFRQVSRNPKTGQMHYTEIDGDTLEEFNIVINCTPLGTFPHVDQKPYLPYPLLGPGHLLYDLIYNPSKTAFLLAGEAQGASIQNGLPMLELQAEKAWEIWTR